MAEKKGVFETRHRPGSVWVSIAHRARRLSRLPAAVFLAGTIISGIALAQSDDREKLPNELRALMLKDQRTALMNCFAASVDQFDDRISPADIVAAAVAWHCQAQRNPDNYWTVLAMRRATPDAVDMFYRDLALPFVLKRRVERLNEKERDRNKPPG
ncbi:MAG: hypothetical protein JSR90_07880 [Proteobacteria bacterium]|nr:hypothetical protein [Pseudomonadota bacterium]